MERLKCETPLDYAVFQLSPKRSRCELFVSSDGSTEKIASGLLKPFVAHLTFAEEQIASAERSVKLEVGRRKNTSWFTKGTLERFVRFVSTPEVLEFVNTCDAEMSQLEAAQRIYSQFQGTGNQLSGGGGSGLGAAEDATKKELLRAIDVRLVAVQQDLSTACARANAAGFNIDSVSELQMFADKFGAHRLNEACCSFISVCKRRSDLISPRKTEFDDGAIRSSYGSDMSLDDDPPSPPPPVPYQRQQEYVTCQLPSSSMFTFPFSRKSSINGDNGDKPRDHVPLEERQGKTSTPDQSQSIQSSQPSRRLSVQDRISMFETKQKDNPEEKAVMAKPTQLRRLSSDVPTLGTTLMEKAMLRRWSGASDMSIDLSIDQRDNDSPLCTPSTAAVSQIKSSKKKNDAATSSYVVPQIKTISSLSQLGGGGLKNASSCNIEASSGSIQSNSNQGSGESDGMKNQVPGRTQWSLTSRVGSRENWELKFKTTPSSKNEDAMWLNIKGSEGSEELIGGQKQISGVKDQCSLTRVMPFRSKSGGPVEISDQREDSESNDQPVAQRYANTSQKTFRESVMFEGGFKFHEPFAIPDKRNGGESLSTQQDVGSIEETKVKKRESRSSDKVSNSSVSTVEDSGPQRLMFNRQGMASENIKKAQFERNESSSIERNESSSIGGNIKTPYLEKIVAEAREGIDSFSTPPTEQTRRARHSKGINHELNDELRMKANELEKLFAQHKLRTPGDQFISSCKVEPETNCMQVFSSKFYDNHQHIEPSSNSRNTSHNYGNTTSKDFPMLIISEGSRGKFYDRYMQKRNAKLREEWSSNRAEKEARLKSMQDSLERNRSEMKIKLSGSAGRRDFAIAGQPHAYRLSSYNSRSILKRERLDL
ncbi:uncharacterized protein [Primulina huaijiensis]|uniref:uncharacterized protein n=1 Tax=Primulina huaijiensis TaxID=1492673 RepID=UPI003CC6F9F5